MRQGAWIYAKLIQAISRYQVHYLDDDKKCAQGKQHAKLKRQWLHKQFLFLRYNTCLVWRHCWAAMLIKQQRFGVQLQSATR